MNASEVERELTAVLHRHAEDAMNRTDTHDERQRLEHRIGGGARHGTRRRWVVGAVAAVVAVLVGFVLWSVNSVDRADSGPTHKSQTTAESLAQRFMDAVAAGDTDRVGSLLAPGAVPGWRDGIWENQVLSREVLPKECAQTSEALNGTTVLCPFDMHVLHSEQLGLGPFTLNSMTVRVKNGRVVEVDVFFPTEADSQEQMFNRVGAWVRAHHPGTWGFMSGPTPYSPAERQRWSRLWQTYSQEYVDATKHESGGG